MAITCKEKARQYVHVTAVGGGALAAAPVPGTGTAGLTALEAALIYWIGRIYGKKLDKSEILLIAGSLEIASLSSARLRLASGGGLAAPVFRHGSTQYSSAPVPLLAVPLTMTTETPRSSVFVPLR